MKNAEEIASAAGYSGKNAVLPEAFVTMFGKMFGQNILDGYLSAEDALPVVRMNPSKPYGRNVLSCMKGQVPWCGNAFTLALRPSFTHDPAFQSGCYYVQDSSSMFMAPFPEYFNNAADTVFKVLDLCAAPGGKTTLLSDLCRTASDRYVIVANEVMRTRATVLADNVARWGDSSIIVTSSDPSDFSTLESVFDMVLADVPCSGEGMFRKDMEAIENWSPDNVRLCSSRQRRIVADVWPALRKGGIFIYSTCTFNRYENDLNVKWIAGNLGASCLFCSDDAGMECGEGCDGVLKTECGFSLVPGLVEGEGQYCSALVKDGHWEADGKNGRRELRKACQPPRMKVDLSSYVSGNVILGCKGELIKALPEAVVSDLAYLESKLRVLSSGCAVGMVKGHDFVPDPDLALSMVFRRDSFEKVDADTDTALKYLHHDALVFRDPPKGILTVCYRGLPLGFVKNLGNRTNIIHPVGRRIRLDIKKVSG